MILSVGPTRIDCDRREIIRDGRVSYLPPKAFELLLALIDARPRIVKKNELLERVWPDTYVSDANLAVLVGDIRAAIGDSARAPTMIKTHHGVGYAFIGSVTEAPRETERSAAQVVLHVGSRRIVLADGRYTVGREKSCDIVLDDRSVSRLHALLHVKGTELTVEDRSKNGTHISGAADSPTGIVRDGQRIVFGAVPVMIAVQRPNDDATVTLRVKTVPPE